MSNPTIHVDLAAQLAAAKARIAELEKPKAMTFKVSDKGCVCVYGLGRFPVALYTSQWSRLLDPKNVQALTAFMVANRATIEANGGVKS